LVAAALAEYVCCVFSSLFPEFSVSLNHKIKASLTNQLKTIQIMTQNNKKNKIDKASISSNTMNKDINYVKADLISWLQKLFNNKAVKEALQ
jgi:hypothetical protein